MTVYLICYDLVSEQNSSVYQDVISRIKKYDCHRIQDSVWLVASDGSAQAVKDHVGASVDGDDLLWVSSVRRGEFSFKRAKGGTNDFLRKHGLQ